MKVYHFRETPFGEMYYCPELKDAVVYKSGSSPAIFFGIKNIDFRDLFEYEEIEDDYIARRLRAENEIKAITELYLNPPSQN